ncbi:AraC family transcriptional regulator [Niastella sp. OAS944]|uniref:AraC family transcriptional regulator n=1 Tax=Niastella sp. OAS944 TaxID=2664089 RepID=UPI003482D722|nr:AraC-like DNA-binding protein [Chitinophagaceae bacterium OAS944]
MNTENLHQPFEIVYKETDECLKPAHKHNFFELCYIIDGSGTHCINKNKFEYRNGHLFLLTPQDSHKLTVRTTTKFFLIRFNDIYFKSQNEQATSQQSEWIKKLEFIFHNTTHSPGCILKGMNDRVLVKALIDGLIKEHINKDPYHQEIIQQMVNTVLSIVARNLYIKVPKKMTFDSNNDETTLKIIHYVQANIYKPELLKAELIASTFQISVNYLSEYFKKHTGETLQNYITNYKLKLVETRLLHSNMRINEIAFELHFTDESHLNRIFKKYKGISPTGFRKQVMFDRQMVIAATA